MSGKDGQRGHFLRAALAACLVSLTSACSTGQAIPRAPSSVADAFRAAHPGGAMPPGLKRSADPSYRRRFCGAGEAPAGSSSPHGCRTAMVWRRHMFPWERRRIAQPADVGWRLSCLVHGRLRFDRPTGGLWALPGGGAWQPLNRPWRGLDLWVRTTPMASPRWSPRSRIGRVAVAVQGVSQKTAVRVLFERSGSEVTDRSREMLRARPPLARGDRRS